MRVVAILSALALAGGLALTITGAGVVPGALLLLVGLLLGAIAGAIAAARRVRDAIGEWRSLVAGGGPDSLRVVGVKPPQGWLFNRDASVTLEVRGEDGTARRLERSIAVPIPQALAWRLAGRAPTPLRRLSEARELDLALYRKRGTSATRSP